MPLISHPFLGAIDLDSPDHVIPRGFVRSCTNIIWRGPVGNKRAENVPGYTAIVNPGLPSVGTNMCISAWYDPVDHIIFDFNYNSAGTHAIYLFFTQTQTWQTLIQTGTNTVGDPLAFSPFTRINSVDIIYQDDNSGNLLFYVDSLKRPTKINIQKYLNNTYTGIQRSYLEVIKPPSPMPPRCTYENDFLVTVNNLKNSLFKFRTRWIYGDNEKSVYSTGSKVPLPHEPSTQIVDSDPEQNSRISVYVPTGDQTVAKIEIWGQQATDSANSNWFLIIQLDKSSLLIPDNTMYRFLFYNDSLYTAGVQSEIDQLEDEVPLQANAQVLLNGNTLMYGGILEGYDPIPINMEVVANNLTIAYNYIINGVLFFAAQGDSDSNGTGNNITIYLTGCGLDDGFGNPIATPLATGTLVVDCATNTGTSLKFQYVLPFSDTITNTLNALKAAAIAQGFAFVSQTPNSVTVSHANVVLYSSFILNQQIPANQPQPTFAYGDQSAYDFAMEYFDDKGRTNGALLPASGGINTMESLDGTAISQITLTIFHRPPPWAASYQIVRSYNLTYNLHEFWVSNQTYQNFDVESQQTFAYIGIGNMVDYNNSIQASTPVVSYSNTSFQPGDRIRFLQRIPFGGTPSNLSTSNDYEIVSVEVNPVLNGIVQNGNFIKILYPASDITSNFAFGGDQFQNYKIIIYNYVKRLTNAQQIIYNEFGTQFAIGNPGTANAFHIGLQQTQKADLSQPAIITMTDGDWFYRQRTVPAGNTYYIPSGNFIFGSLYATFNTTPLNGDITNTQYIISHQVAHAANLDSASYPTFGDDKFLFENLTSTPRQLRVRGEFTVQCAANNSTYTAILAKAVTSTGVTVSTILQNFDLPLGENIQSYDLPFDGYIQVPANAKVWLIAENGLQVVNLRIGVFNLRLDVLDNVAINIYEQSYSDRYNIVTNSNLRPSVYDPNAGQFYFSTLVRYSESDQLGTNLNNSNRFYEENFDEFDKSKGDIVRMIGRQREVDVFHTRRCGHFGVYAKFVKNNSGTTELVVSDTIITPNNIQYYDGQFGVGNQPDGICVSGYDRYFTDPVKGALCRLSLDGVKDISEEFKVQTWAGANLINYLNPYTYPYGGNSVILAVYNITPDRDNEAIFVLQPGVKSGSFNGPASVIGQALAFNERSNAFTSFYQDAPDAMVCAENVLYSFFNGVMYSRTNTTEYCNFYGVQQVPQIIIPYNDFKEERKEWLAISELSNGIWNAPLIYSDEETYPGQRQETKLIDQNFTRLEGKYESAFLRDIHSQKGWVNGDFMKGTLLIATLQPTDGSKFIYLASAGVLVKDSPLNSK